MSSVRSRTASPINLSRKTDFEEGYIATVSGWGTTSEGGPASNVLRKVDLPIRANDGKT